MSMGFHIWLFYSKCLFLEQSKSMCGLKPVTVISTIIRTNTNQNLLLWNWSWTHEKKILKLKKHQPSLIVSFVGYAVVVVFSYSFLLFGTLFNSILSFFLIFSLSLWLRLAHVFIGFITCLLCCSVAVFVIFANKFYGR